MKATSIFAAAVLGVFYVACGSVSAQRTTPDSEKGMSCVEHLVVPGYPGLANRARVRGGVKVSIRLKPDGSVQTVSFEPPDNLGEARLMAISFHQEIERAMRASKFLSLCGGRSIAVAFEFRLLVNVDDDYRGVAFRYPNVFEVSASEPRVTQ